MLSGIQDRLSQIIFSTMLMTIILTNSNQKYPLNSEKI